MTTVADVLSLLGATAIGGAGTYAASRAAGKASVKAEQVSADSGAFTRALDIYEQGRQEMDARVNGLRDDLDKVVKSQRETQEELARAMDQLRLAEEALRESRREVRDLRRTVAQWEGRVMQLTEVLRLHEIEVPPWAGAALDGATSPPTDPNQPPRTHPDPTDDPT